MKKTYINPKMRLVNLTEADAVLIVASPDTQADPNSPNLSRRERSNDWDEEDW